MQLHQNAIYMITSISCNMHLDYTFKFASSLIFLHQLPIGSFFKDGKNRPKGTQHGWPLFHQQHCKNVCCPRPHPYPMRHSHPKNNRMSATGKGFINWQNRNKWKMIINLHLQSKTTSFQMPSHKFVIQSKALKDTLPTT